MAAFRDAFWPRLTTVQRAARAVRDAAIGAYLVAAITGAIGIYTLVAGPAWGFDGWGILDALFLLVAGWRIGKFSRSWAIAIVVYWIGSMAYKASHPQVGLTPVGIITVLILLVFINGVRGVRAYKKLSAQPDVATEAPRLSRGRFAAGWFAAGGGFAVVSAVMIAGILWYTSRPVPWNTGALLASGGEIGMTVRRVPPSTASTGLGVAVDPTAFRVSYTIENRTNHDITISPLATLMTRRGSDGALDFPRSALAGTPLRLFVPARQRAMFHLQIPYTCTEMGFEGHDLKRCLAHLLNDADGLVVIDKSQHLELRLPKPFWKSGTVDVFLEAKP